MKVRKGLVGVACAALAAGMFCNSSAWADSSTSVTSSDSPLQVPSYLDDTTAPAAPASAPAAPTTPLMMALDKVGAAAPLQNLGISINGYVEAGYSYDLTVPHDRTPAKSAPGNGIFFEGPYKNAVLLDQADLQIARSISNASDAWNVGFEVEALYGTDAAFIHSNGILDNNTKHASGPDNQFDLEQAFVTVNVPLGAGVLVKAGKFATLLGAETIDPYGAAGATSFYSHSYSFSYGIPLTQTGILFNYPVTSAISATAGITRGWNQSSSDNNGSADFLGEVAWTYSPKLTVTGNLSWGPEGFLTFGPGDNSDYWTVPEIIAAYKVSDQLTVTGDLVYGDAPHGVVAGLSTSEQWYGLCLYGSYVVNNYFTLNGRAELYHDGHGETTGFGAADGGEDLNFWEFTAGVAITPMPDNAWLKSLILRPELRLDMADHNVFDNTGPGTGQFNEVTAGLDVIWGF